MQKAFLIIATLLLNYYAIAHNYGEHKFIGDAAMQRWVAQNSSTSFLEKYFPLTKSEDGSYYFSQLSTFNKVTYGTINGLSGDHSGSVFELAQLLSQNSYLQTVIKMHGESIAAGLSAAPDKKLLKVDKKYAALALKNMAHFYKYGSGWHKHLSKYKPDYIKGLIDKDRSKKIFDKLNSSNALLMYTTLHQAAIYLAKQAAISAKQNEQ